MIKIKITKNNQNIIKEFNNMEEIKNYLKEQYWFDEWNYNHLINFGTFEDGTNDVYIKIIQNKED